MTNKEFAEKDGRFRKACELAEIPATQRQASKYRRGIGKAFPFRNQAGKKVEVQDGMGKT